MSRRARNWAGAMLKRAGESAGLEIRRFRPPAERRAALLRERDVELVIDVGANRGQYAQQLRNHGYGGRIESFEPCPEAFGTLERRAAADPQWRVRRVAASDEQGYLELGIADDFSSALPAERRLTALFPEAAARYTERAPASRLDGAGIELPESGRVLLKLDVQGYERRALAGASGIFTSIAIIETELSVDQLYRDQPLFSEMVCLLDEQGYELIALDPVLRDRRSGEYLQFDGVFVRR